MTTTTQNTVFTVTPVAVKAEPARCETGNLLGKARIESPEVINTKITEEFVAAEAPFYLAYLSHVVSCPACLEYEQSRGRMVTK